MGTFHAIYATFPPQVDHALSPAHISCKLLALGDASKKTPAEESECYIRQIEKQRRVGGQEEERGGVSDGRFSTIACRRAYDDRWAGVWRRVALHLICVHLLRAPLNVFSR